MEFTSEIAKDDEIKINTKIILNRYFFIL
jgi:hypothetical protein